MSQQALGQVWLRFAFRGGGGQSGDTEWPFVIMRLYLDRVGYSVYLGAVHGETELRVLMGVPFCVALYCGQVGLL